MLDIFVGFKVISLISRVHRAVRGEVLVQPAASGRPVRPGRARGLQRERARGVHGAAHPHQPRRPQRGDGQDLLQPGDQGAVGQVPRAGDGDDHHQVGTVRSGGKTGRPQSVSRSAAALTLEDTTGNIIERKTQKSHFILFDLK